MGVRTEERAESNRDGNGDWWVVEKGLRTWTGNSDRCGQWEKEMEAEAGWISTFSAIYHSHITVAL